MKKALLLFSILVTMGSVKAQQSDPISFKGIWVTGHGGDASTGLNFLDSNKLFFSMFRNDRSGGVFYYKIEKSNTAFVLTLRPEDSTRTDSFRITLTRIGDEELKLNTILHIYDDGRPPESYLRENYTCILNKIK
jgi:hypothetical protein